MQPSNGHPWVRPEDHHHLEVHHPEDHPEDHPEVLVAPCRKADHREQVDLCPDPRYPEVLVVVCPDHPDHLEQAVA